MRAILLLGSLFIPALVLAFPPMPNMCPPVTNIQTIGLSQNLIQDANGRWYAGRTIQSYGTNVKWSFAIGNIPAPSKVEALEEAYEGLSTLFLVSGPNTGPSNKWVCIYQNSEELPCAAVSPPITMLTSVIR